MKHLEDLHQASFIAWSKSKRFNSLKHPDVEKVDRYFTFLFAIPNGGARNAKEGQRLKLSGVTKGIPDLFFSYPHNGYHGLYLEFKKPIIKGKAKPTVSKEQLLMIETFSRVGYKCLVVYGQDEAMAAIEEYLN